MGAGLFQEWPIEAGTEWANENEGNQIQFMCSLFAPSLALARSENTYSRHFFLSEDFY